MILSIVIPLYNCERYILRCLEQICSSGVDSEQFEIIVINDGSKDGSDAEIQKFRNKYPSCILTYIVTENKGASAARNRGIEEAKGDFIWFVDADDLIHPVFFARIIERLEHCKDDLICFNHATISHNNETKEFNEFKEELQLSGVDYLKRRPYNYVWNKIFRRSSIGTHRFLNGIRNTEDWLFLMTSVVNMQNVICIPETGYYYNTANLGSTLRNRTIENLKKNYADTQLVHKTLKIFIENLNDNNKCKVLTEALNYSIIGFFYAMFIDKMPYQYIANVINKYKSLELYPLKKTFHKRANYFRILLNNRLLFLTLVHLRSQITKKAR